MKKTDKISMNPVNDDDMSEHYDFDYSQAQPNRFAPILAGEQGFVKLQPDIQKVFQTSDQVNDALRVFINAISKKNNRKLQNV